MHPGLSHGSNEGGGASFTGKWRSSSSVQTGSREGSFISIALSLIASRSMSVDRSEGHHTKTNTDNTATVEHRPPAKINNRVLVILTVKFSADSRGGMVSTWRWMWNSQQNQSQGVARCGFAWWSGTSWPAWSSCCFTAVRNKMADYVAEGNWFHGVELDSPQILHNFASPAARRMCGLGIQAQRWVRGKVGQASPRGPAM